MSLVMLLHNTRVMSYGSKTISRKLAAIRQAASHAQNLAPAIAAAIEADLRGLEAPGEQLPDLRLLVGLIGRELEEVGGQLAAVHQSHHLAMAQESHHRAELRAAAVALRKHLAHVRFVFDRHFGERQGVANFEGRQDVLRIPMHSLERIASGLLAVFADPRFGWSSSQRPEMVSWVHAELAELIEKYREAQEVCRDSHSRRIFAAGEARRRYSSGGEQVRQSCALFAGVLCGAGFEDIARRLRPKRRQASRQPPARREKAATVATGAAQAPDRGPFRFEPAPLGNPVPRISRHERRAGRPARALGPAAPS